ncbi:MAG: hypothetical protein APR63_01680 [Desulfuromonas sp. SDB]|nr:MAG: hypothetical protein APR63_01680 [Desulfuromonas sp. SDB]
MTISAALLAIFLMGNLICPNGQNIGNSDILSKNPHMNNNLWTGFSNNGDIGTNVGPSFEFPGGSGKNYLFQGSIGVGFINGNDTVVVSTQLC